MKIAFFNYLRLENGGGAERFILNASIGLKKKYPELKISIITYESVNSISRLRNILKDFDVIYSRNDLREAIILKFLVGYKNLKKVIFGFHTSIYFGLPPNWQFPLLKFLYGFFNYKFLLNKADKFHVVNSFAERELKHIFKDKDVVKIYNPLPSFWGAKPGTRRFLAKRLQNRSSNNDSGPHSAEATRGKQAGMTKLLWVGRLNREKGAKDLIKLIRLVNTPDNRKKIIWNIVGLGELEEDVKILTREFDNIKSLGHIDNQKLAEIYSENDLFLSTSQWESFPYTFLEAQTFGLPIISYNIHGCNEIVKDGVNGYLVNSFEEFKNKLIYLIRNPKKIIIKESIKKYIRKLVNNEEIYKKLYELLQ